MVESFVDRRHFQATAYKAGAWDALGYTAGFKRVQEDFWVQEDFYQRHDQPKELWMKALDPDAWDWLRAARFPEHLAAYTR